VDADVFLLNDRKPALLPSPGGALGEPGLSLARSEAAPQQLLRDLSSDRGMGWLAGSGMWFTYIRIHTTAGALTYDLAIDPSGRGRPSAVDAGLVGPGTRVPAPSSQWPLWAALAVIAVLALIAAA